MKIAKVTRPALVKLGKIFEQNKICPNVNRYNEIICVLRGPNYV